MSRAHWNQHHQDDIDHPSDIHAITALEAFIHASTWGSTCRMLQEQQIELTSAPTLTFLCSTIAQLHQNGDLEREAYLKQHLHLLEDAHIYGAAEAWQRFEQEREQEAVNRIAVQLQDEMGMQALIESLASLMQTANTEHEIKLPQDGQQAEVLPDTTQALMQNEIAEHFGDPDTIVIDILERHLRLLKEARTFNLATAWKLFESSE